MICRFGSRSIARLSAPVTSWLRAGRWLAPVLALCFSLAPVSQAVCSGTDDAPESDCCVTLAEAPCCCQPVSDAIPEQDPCDCDVEDESRELPPLAESATERTSSLHGVFASFDHNIVHLQSARVTSPALCPSPPLWLLPEERCSFLL